MSTKDTIYLIGNAHLDPTWLWRWQEGCGEVLQTFRSALDRLKEYPGFVFTCSSACYYRWVEEIDPEMFAEIQQAVADERWVPVNGWWVQPDCNMPNGESFARQALYSQLYYYEKFGKICRTGYNVDSFGHNGMLPQLLRHGGMNAYVMMRPDASENGDAPQNAFWWESADGSRVMTYRIPTGYAQRGKEALTRTIGELTERGDASGHGMMLFYGVGNHGGGPTRGDIEFLIENKKMPGKHELEFSSPDEFFQELCMTRVDLPVWKDDLQHHASGCYSATSLVKQLNRRAENHLAAAEKWDSIAAKTTGSPFSTAAFADAWREVCYNQFHDVLCGCSIMEAYEDVKECMGYAMNIGSKVYNAATLRIAREIDTWIDGVSEPVNCELRHRYSGGESTRANGGDPFCTEVRHHSAPNGFPRPIVVFNPLSWAIEMPVRVYHPSQNAQNSKGENVVFQNVRSSRSNDSHMDTMFLAKVPAMGYATYWLFPLDDEEVESESAVQADEKPAIYMENEYLKVVFDSKTGGIASLIRKADGTDFAGAANFGVPTVIDDHKTDTWAHKVFKFHDIKGTMQLDDIELVEEGPARALVRTKHSFGKSVLTQEFILGLAQKTLRVKCKAIWQEQFTMLKFPFAVEGTDEISTYEIPCGTIKRPCNGEEEPAQNWADITVTGADGKRRGLSLLNDSKYSYDCPGKELSLTALRNVIFADHYSTRPPANFHFTDEGLQRFEYGIYLHEGEAECSEVIREAAAFNCRPVAVPESYHKGKGKPQDASFLTIDAPNILVTALKACEDGSGDLILRCYESAGKRTRAMILCDMADAGFWVDFGKNQIKTFRIAADGSVMEVNFLEGIVAKSEV